MNYQTAYSMMSNNNLQILRKEHGLTQGRICEILQGLGFEIERSTYSKYETGKRKLQCEVLIALADYYNVTTDYILGLDNK